jgi:2-phospho-L-lactate guanylyltransferase
VIAALVPVKALADAKTRLADGDRARIEALSLAMMGDVLEALLRVPEIDRVAAVTPDRDVADAARRVGAAALLRDDPGLNAAIDAGGALLAPGADDALLVVLGDVAAVDPEEVSDLLRALPHRGAALAPSRDGGTSALARRPRDVIPSCFGADSAKRHREAAERAGVALRELALPSLSIDVDVAEDARAILARETLGRRTRALLTRMQEDLP